jgi:hypothetical protein
MSFIDKVADALIFVCSNELAFKIALGFILLQFIIIPISKLDCMWMVPCESQDSDVSFVGAIFSIIIIIPVSYGVGHFSIKLFEKIFG